MDPRLGGLLVTTYNLGGDFREILAELGLALEALARQSSLGSV